MSSSSSSSSSSSFPLSSILKTNSTNSTNSILLCLAALLVIHKQYQRKILMNKNGMNLKKQKETVFDVMVLKDFLKNKNENTRIITLSLPTIPLFYASNTSFVINKEKNQCLLNVRYISYKMAKNGSSTSVIQSFKNFIQSKNLACFLNPLDLTQILYSKWMPDYIDSIPRNVQCKIKGLEDIRLFEDEKNEIHYIASQAEYSSLSQSSLQKKKEGWDLGTIKKQKQTSTIKATTDTIMRMITGKYDFENAIFLDNFILEPPTPTRVEKNWIPISFFSKKNGKMENLFIYGWKDSLQIGKIINTNSNDKKLEIIVKHKNKIPFFNQLRGSTIFSEHKNQLWGVVHFSYHNKQNRIFKSQYYHIVLVLDIDTLEPILCSKPFVFERIGVEYCSGFYIDTITGDAHFWYTKNDENPSLLKTSIHNIPMFEI